MKDMTALENSAAAEKAGTETVTVTPASLAFGYTQAMLELVARNNPKSCRFEDGKLTIGRREYLLFSKGLAETQKSAGGKEW